MAVRIFPPAQREMNILGWTGRVLEYRLKNVKLIE
jgi:hypothetical protein